MALRLFPVFFPGVSLSLKTLLGVLFMSKLREVENILAEIALSMKASDERETRWKAEWAARQVEWAAESAARQAEWAAESAARKKEADERKAEWEAESAVRKKEWAACQAEWAAESAERKKEADERKKEADERKKEADERKKEADKRKKEADERQERLSRDVDLLVKQVKTISLEIGGVSNRVGSLAEFVVLPGIRLKMKEFGYDFDVVEHRWKDGRKHNAIEVDLFLRNTVEAMAVEVKTSLTHGWVDKHLNRLAKMREREDKVNIKGMALYGGVAGIDITPEAEKLALENGLYVIEVIEYGDRLDVTAPKPEKLRAW
jgi:hypothetical protein